MTRRAFIGVVLLLLVLASVGLPNSTASTATQPSGVTLNPDGMSYVSWMFDTPAPYWSLKQTSGEGFHLGDDFYADDWARSPAATFGQDIYASISGIAAIRDYGNTSYGKSVVIYDPDSHFAIRYAHLSQFLVSSGDHVTAGSTVVGKVGSSGTSTGPHIHVVLYKNVSGFDGRPVQSDSNSYQGGPSAYAAQFGYVSKVSGAPPSPPDTPNPPPPQPTPSPSDGVRLYTDDNGRGSSRFFTEGGWYSLASTDLDRAVSSIVFFGSYQGNYTVMLADQPDGSGGTGRFDNDWSHLTDWNDRARAVRIERHGPPPSVPSTPTPSPSDGVRLYTDDNGRGSSRFFTEGGWYSLASTDLDRAVSSIVFFGSYQGNYTVMLADQPDGSGGTGRFDNDWSHLTDWNDRARAVRIERHGIPPPAPIESLTQVVAPLDLWPQSPLVGQAVTASFTLRNTGGQSTTMQKLIVAVRGPNASGISDNTKIVDFRFDENVTLGPGQAYTYRQERSFFETGTYLAFATYQDAQGVWRGPFSGTTPVSFAVTRLSATIRGNTPRITSVQFTSSGRDSRITVNGTGFGEAPVNMPFTGDLPHFMVYLHSTDGAREWSAGYDGGPGNITWVTLRYASWNDTQIQIDGFAGDYGQNGYTVVNGDTLGVAFRNCVIGPASEWSGVVGAAPIESLTQVVTPLALTASNTSVSVGNTVILTAVASQDVRSTPYYIVIRNQTAANTIVARVGSGTTAVYSITGGSPATHSFAATIEDSNGRVQSSSGQVSVTWTGAPSRTPSASQPAVSTHRFSVSSLWRLVVSWVRNAISVVGQWIHALS